ncbi:hypothetical protein [Variovorax paradoxus]|jgi:hypothetical protein|nr:hypothetical protein [Variovorax paradoxus]WPH20871.1 hypothetical protein RZE78_01610 [Variovorax paradoxus]
MPLTTPVADPADKQLYDYLESVRWILGAQAMARGGVTPQLRLASR